MGPAQLARPSPVLGIRQVVVGGLSGRSASAQNGSKDSARAADEKSTAASLGRPPRAPRQSLNGQPSLFPPPMNLQRACSLGSSMGSDTWSLRSSKESDNSQSLRAASPVSIQLRALKPPPVEFTDVHGVTRISVTGVQLEEADSKKDELPPPPRASTVFRDAVESRESWNPGGAPPIDLGLQFQNAGWNFPKPRDGHRPPVVYAPQSAPLVFRSLPNESSSFPPAPVANPTPAADSNEAKSPTVPQSQVTEVQAGKFQEL